MNQPKKKKSKTKKYEDLANVVKKSMNVAFLPLGPLRRTTLLSVISEYLVPVVEINAPDGKHIKFWCFGGWSSYRAHSALEKEPHTIKWIDGFKPGCVFWDIGANVGVFSLYAAAVKGARTYGFEPSASNFAVFCRNIELNKLDHLITSLCIAFTDKSGLDYMSMRTTQAGNTGGQFSSDGKNAPQIFRQGCLGYTIDEFIEKYSLPIPHYIKIDVDGLEEQIIKGAANTLQNPQVQEMILEFERESEALRQTTDFLAERGFVIESDYPTVPGKDSVRNYIFKRK